MKQTKIFGRAIFFLVFLPLFLPVTAYSLGLISETMATLMKVTSHLTMFIALLVCLLSRNTFVVKSLHGRSTWSVLLFPCFVIIPTISILFNGVDALMLLRFFLCLVYVFNMLILYPLVIEQFEDVTYFFTSLCNMYVIFSLLALIFFAAVHFSGHSPYLRLGYPLRPGVFAYYMFPGWLITYIFQPNIVLNIIFAAAIVLSGSRAAVAMLGLFIAVDLLFSKGRRWTKKIAISALIAITVMGIYLIREQSLHPYLAEREDITTHRVIVWAEASQMMERRLFTGYGAPQEIEVRIPGRTMVEAKGTHNSFIDLTLQYGILYAFLGYMVWFIHFFPRKPRINQHIYWMQIALFLGITFKSLVTNTFWLNLGDACTFFLSLLLLVPIAQFKPNQPVRATCHPGSL